MEMHWTLTDASCSNSLGVSDEMRQGSVVTVTDYSHGMNVHSPPLKSLWKTSQCVISCKCPVGMFQV